ncbi:MAG: hypothetical protein RLZZ604_1211, partial [Pseudomonadota bacterium]
DPWVIEGQGTAGIEIAKQLQSLGMKGPDLIVSCCGGGGLAAGLALACPDADIAIVEPEGWDDIIRSLEAGEILPVPRKLRRPTQPRFTGRVGHHRRSGGSDAVGV